MIIFTGQNLWSLRCNRISLGYSDFGHIQRRPAEAPVRSGVIRRSGNEKRSRGRPNLTWEESVKRDLKDWCITKELTLDRREWKLAIHVPEP
jgi:hypothetical protein